MSDYPLERLKDLVDQALEQPSDHRIAFLESHCADQPELLDRAKKLLGFENRASSFLESPPSILLSKGLVGDPMRELADESDQPKEIGRYRILRRIASGGAGTVYEAEQDQPQRTVALKILRADAHSPALVRRFEREADLLAHVHHPAIAHVYEAGIHEDGALRMPFIAMELVPDARTIISYATEMDLSIRERLELFIQVCKAVQHAHDRGIVHRDLKPANILVDAIGHPKVIDFGVARIREEEHSLVLTQQTRAGDIIGTLPYMAPEQCGGDATLVDARADVYALGVVLFELLAGRLPLVLAGLPFDQAIHRIREHLPERLKRVAPELDADLDIITSKALRKDPEDRYQSAAALAADLRRYLDHEPVVARAPTMIYQGRLFVRRHRVIVAAATIAFISLVAATLTSLSFAVHAHNSARLESQTRRRAELINSHLENMLVLPDPHLHGENVRVVEMLDQMVKRLDAEPDEFPDVEASVRNMIGGTYLSLRRSEEAVVQLQRAVELLEPISPESDEMASIYNQLGLALRYVGRLEEAEQAFRKAVAVRRKQPRDDAQSMSVELGNLAGTLIELGKWNEAEPIVKEVLKIRQMEQGEISIVAAASWRQLARVQQGRKAWLDAEKSTRQALEVARQVVPEDHPIIAASLGELGSILMEQGRTDEAITAVGEAWELVRKARPITSPDWLHMLQRYVQALQRADRQDDAESVLQSAIEQLTTELGPNDTRTREAQGVLDALRLSGAHPNGDLKSTTSSSDVAPTSTDEASSDHR